MRIKLTKYSSKRGFGIVPGPFGFGSRGFTSMKIAHAFPAGYKDRAIDGRLAVRVALLPVVRERDSEAIGEGMLQLDDTQHASQRSIGYRARPNPSRAGESIGAVLAMLLAAVEGADETVWPVTLVASVKTLPMAATTVRMKRRIEVCDRTRCRLRSASAP